MPACITRAVVGLELRTVYQRKREVPCHCSLYDPGYANLLHEGKDFISRPPWRIPRVKVLTLGPRVPEMLVSAAAKGFRYQFSDFKKDSYIMKLIEEPPPRVPM